MVFEPHICMRLGAYGHDNPYYCGTCRTGWRVVLPIRGKQKVISELAGVKSFIGLLTENMTSRKLNFSKNGS